MYVHMYGRTTTVNTIQALFYEPLYPLLCSSVGRSFILQKSWKVTLPSIGVLVISVRPDGRVTVSSSSGAPVNEDLRRESWCIG